MLLPQEQIHAALQSDLSLTVAHISELMGRDDRGRFVSPRTGRTASGPQVCEILPWPRPGVLLVRSMSDAVFFRDLYNRPAPQRPRRLAVIERQKEVQEQVALQMECQRLLCRYELGDLEPVFWEKVERGMSPRKAMRQCLWANKKRDERRGRYSLDRETPSGALLAEVTTSQSSVTPSYEFKDPEAVLSEDRRADGLRQLVLARMSTPLVGGLDAADQAGIREVLLNLLDQAASEGVRVNMSEAFRLAHVDKNRARVRIVKTVLALGMRDAGAADCLAHAYD